MNSNINGDYAIAEDGTIKRPYSELDAAMLNIIRVGANKDDLLAAYRARKKCYKLCQQTTGRLDYKEYVETLQLDNFPNELKKADYGKRYINLLWGGVLSLILGLGGLIFGLYWCVEDGVRWEYEYDYDYNYNHRFFAGFDWDDLSVGLMSLGVAVGLFCLAKYLLKRLKETSQAIEELNK